MTHEILIPNWKGEESGGSMRWESNIFQLLKLWTKRYTLAFHMPLFSLFLSFPSLRPPPLAATAIGYYKVFGSVSLRFI